MCKSYQGAKVSKLSLASLKPGPRPLPSKLSRRGLGCLRRQGRRTCEGADGCGWWLNPKSLQTIFIFIYVRIYHILVVKSPKMTKQSIWRFPSHGGSPNHPSHGCHSSIESHGDLGMPHSKKHPNDSDTFRNDWTMN
jgi:hypothetical protein